MAPFLPALVVLKAVFFNQLRNSPHVLREQNNMSRLSLFEIRGLDARSRRPDLPVILSGKQGRIMAEFKGRLAGYDISYTHRGSWKANLRHRGKVVLEAIPVAWDTDLRRDHAKQPTLGIWFKDKDEAKQRLALDVSIAVALAKKTETDASAENISNIFEVTPIDVADNTHLLTCLVNGPWQPKD